MSLPTLKPKPLKAGACLAVVSPASAARPELINAGMDRLEAMGYRPRLGEHALLRGPLYYAGTARERVADLHAAFADPEVDGIVCTRGGWGSAELLPLLDADLIRRNPKPFIGYSDHTSLTQWLRRYTGLVSFYGPMVAADLSKSGGADEASWAHALTGSETWSLGPAEGLRILRPGIADGTLTGGCLAIVEASLGTPYAPEPEGGILFLEDIGVKPYQWDRMLQHLRFAGMLAGVTGIVLGDMAQSCPSDEQELLIEAIQHALGDFAGPVAIGLRSGHVAAGNVTLPLGIRVRLDLTDEANPRMHFLEPATAG